MSPKNIALAGILLCELVAGCTTGTTSGQQQGKWKPIGNRKARVVHWGIIHNHSIGKWDAVRKLTNDFEIVGWVDDTASKAMRMAEPNVKRYDMCPRLTPQQVFDEVKPDLIVVETANSELVDVSTEIAKHGIPMHMDKPLGVDQAGFMKMSRICEELGVPLQIGYMFRSNEAINKMVELAHDGILGEIYSIDADLDHNYGYPKYPDYASHYRAGRRTCSLAMSSSGRCRSSTTRCRRRPIRSSSPRRAIRNGRRPIRSRSWSIRART